MENNNSVNVGKEHSSGERDESLVSHQQGVQPTFTPGPWEAGMYKMQPTIFWGRGNGTVAIASVHDIASMGDPKANARLIAAAPALYEALKAVRETYFCDHTWQTGRLVKLCPAIDAALALVRGDVTERETETTTEG